MPNLLTIPTEIRLKILNYAVCDVTVQEVTPAMHSDSWVLHGSTIQTSKYVPLAVSFAMRADHNVVQSPS